ncbi:hypothetical protein IV102_32445 [bacterium]|nr:hypothetical protein [bacterium]
MFGINRNLPPTPMAGTGFCKGGPAKPAPSTTSPSADRVEIGGGPAQTSSSPRLGGVLMGAGVLGFAGVVAGVMAGLFATPVVVAVAAVASVLAVGAGGMMLGPEQADSPAQAGVQTQWTQDGQSRQTLPLGEPGGPGGVSQSLDLSNGQVIQEVNVGNGWYLDPSTGQMVFHP